MSEEQRKTSWMKVFILCLGGGTIYILPYLRYGYYDAMIEGMNLTNTQLGTIMGAYGFFAIPAYLIGGILADKFRAKDLLIFSFLSTGLGGFYLATLPGYLTTLLIHGFWGISTTLTFWSAFHKTTRLSATPETQGKIFGTVTGGRKIFSMIVASTGLWIFALYPTADQVSGFQSAVIFFSVVHIIIAALFFLGWKEEKVDSTEKTEQGGIKLSDLKTVLMMKETWLLTGITFGVYGTYRFGDFFTPYLSNGIGVGAALAGVIGYAKSYAITPVGSFVSGLVADKIGRIKWSLLVVAASVVSKLLFNFIPAGAEIIAIINIVLFMALIWAAYTLLFALLDDLQIPEKYSGTVIGVASCLGLSPEAISPVIGGYILDTYEGLTGFKILFTISACWGVFAVFMYLLTIRYIAKKKAIDS